MTLRGPRPGRVGALLRQGAEYAIAALLGLAALHAGHHIIALLGASVVVAGWAAAQDGPLGLVPVVGLTAHRVGLLLEAIVLLAAPFALGHPTDLALSGPLVLAAVFLVQLASPRTAVRPSPAPRSHTAAADNTRTRSSTTARVTGHWLGRTGTLVSQYTSGAVPAGARRAGRLAGRLARRRTTP